MNDTSTEACENSLARVLTNDDLVAFLVGEQPYFTESHSDEGEPQDAYRATERCLLSYWQDSRFPYPSRCFADTLLEIPATYPDRSRAIYVARNWVWYYRSYLSKKRTNPQGPYGDLSEVDFGAAAVVLKRQLGANKDELVHGTCWVDVTWNNNNGLWGSLLRISTMVRDRFDGSDFVSDTP